MGFFACKGWNDWWELFFDLILAIIEFFLIGATFEPADQSLDKPFQMIKHALKIAFRNFRRSKSTFLINVVGLSTGLACALLIFMWVTDELQVDKFHHNNDRLYYVMEHQQYADNIMTTLSTPGLLAQTLKEEVPEIEHAITMMWPQTFTLSLDDKNLKVFGRHVGSEFFKIFTHPLIMGDAEEVLRDHTSLVISESLAERMFGSPEAAIGKTVKYEQENDFMIKGIFEDVPTTSSQSFEALLPYDRYLNLSENSWLRNWGSNSPPTIVTLKEGVDAETVSAKIADFVKDRNEQSNVQLFLKKYSERYLYGKYENGQLAGGRIEYVRLFSIIAVFLLLIACINFMNLSTARGTTRAKEVGVKKTMGIPKFSLIGQYLTESVLVSVCSLVLAVLWILILMPTFNELTDKSLGLSTITPGLLIGFLGVTLLTGLVSGSYPALYLSSFKPVDVLKGEIRSSWGEIWARKGLVVFQFTLSVILIIAVMVVYQQIEFVQSKNLGYDKDQLVSFNLDGTLEEQGALFAQQIQNLPGVVNAATIGHELVGRQNNTSGLTWEGKNPADRILFENVAVGYDLLETIGVRMKAGRMFQQAFGQDTNKIIFNETAVKIMGLEEPIGQRIRLWDQYDLEIIGVVEDFHFQSLHEPVKPLFFRLHPDNTWTMMAKLEGGREKEALKNIEQFYSKFNPGFPFEYRFVDDEYAKQYAAEQRVSKLSKYFAGLAILISCLGLFGLAAFTGERRRKEIGVRKVLGASVNQIVYLLTRDFTRLVLLALLIGLPIAYFLLQRWLTRFEYRIPLQLGFFIGAGLLLLLVAWATVGGQAWSAARVHPSECMKEE